MSAYDLLIVSDLHLSEGRDSFSRRVSRHEDFFFDEEFREFLRHHREDPPWQERNWMLVINGDFVDFLQVTSLPESREGFSLDPEYGLKTGARESAWKMEKIVRGHRIFFEALAEFAVRFPVVVVAGNHDIEFYYPEVQDALRESLDACIRDETARRQLRRNLFFRPWFFFDGGIYIEHGHQYDPLNAFKYQLDPRLPELAETPSDELGHIDLPFGSLFVRYLFNRIEIDSPFADNVKPATRFIGWLILNQPLRGYQFLLGEGHQMLQRIKEKWQFPGEQAYEIRRRLHADKIHEEAARLASDESDRPAWTERLQQLDALKEPPVLKRPAGLKWRMLRLLTGPYRLPALIYLLTAAAVLGLTAMLLEIVHPVLPAPLQSLQWPIPPALWKVGGPALEIVRWIFLIELVCFSGWVIRRRAGRPRHRERLRLRAKAAAIRRLFNADYVIMGHTHDPDIWKLENGATYFNSGTWTKVFSDEPRLVREEKELTFVRLLRSEGEAEAQLLKWEGRQALGQLVYLFDQD